MIELNARRLGVDATVAADYAAARDGAALIELTATRWMRFSGAGARDALNGILTCDLAEIGAGSGAYGVALTPKGKVIADVSVFGTSDGFLVEVPSAAWPGWLDMVTKFVNPRLAKRTDESETTGAFAVVGPRSAELISTLLSLDSATLDAWQAYENLDIPVDGGRVNVARIPDYGADGLRVAGPRATVESLADRAEAAGARLIGESAITCLRIEAGRPAWGVDMDGSTLPQEANLEALGAISYTKGCYTGQEVIARLHFRGHVNKRLVGLRVDGPHPPTTGTLVMNGDAEAGEVRSAILSPRFGAIALAMLRREVEIGATVTVVVDEVQRHTEVSALPFG